MSGYSEQSVFAVVPTEVVLARIYAVPIGSISLAWSNSYNWSNPYNRFGFISIVSIEWNKPFAWSNQYSWGMQPLGARGYYGGTMQTVFAKVSN